MQVMIQTFYLTMSFSVTCLPWKSTQTLADIYGSSMLAQPLLTYSSIYDLSYSTGFPVSFIYSINIFNNLAKLAQNWPVMINPKGTRHFPLSCVYFFFFDLLLTFCVIGLKLIFLSHEVYTTQNLWYTERKKKK